MKIKSENAQQFMNILQGYYAINKFPSSLVIIPSIILLPKEETLTNTQKKYNATGAKWHD